MQPDIILHTSDITTPLLVHLPDKSSMTVIKFGKCLDMPFRLNLVSLLCTSSTHFPLSQTEPTKIQSLPNWWPFDVNYWTDWGREGRRERRELFALLWQNLTKETHVLRTLCWMCVYSNDYHFTLCLSTHTYTHNQSHTGDEIPTSVWISHDKQKKLHGFLEHLFSQVCVCWTI